MPAVTVQRDGQVCRLRLSRPDKLNALNGAVYEGLRAEFARLAEDTDTTVLVISGEGRAFSAGVDLGALGGRPVARDPVGRDPVGRDPVGRDPVGRDPVVESGRDPGRGSESAWVRRRHEMGRWQRLLDLLEQIPQVTVAAVHGHCVGGAALLAVSCDIRIGADDLQVRIPELAIGIPLTWAGIPRLARELGLPVARDLVMTGRVLDANAALAAGFIQRLVPRGMLDEATDSLVAELLAMPAGPLAMTRAMFSAIARERLGAAAWADADLLGWASSEPEGRDAAARYWREHDQSAERNES